MYCAIDGKFVVVRHDTGRMERRLGPMQYPIIGAQVSGDNVIIQCAQGWTFVYTLGGMLIRKTKG